MLFRSKRYETSNIEIFLYRLLKFSFFGLGLFDSGIKLKIKIQKKPWRSKFMKEFVPTEIKNCVSRPFCKTVTPDIRPKHRIDDLLSGRK